MVSSSTSCPPPCEICTSQETSCTTYYHGIMDKIPLIGSYNITVKATSDHGEVFSNQYEFQPMKICEYHKVMDMRCTHEMCLSFTSIFPSVMFHCACVCSVKIPPPRFSILKAPSDHVLVKWSNLYRVSSNHYNCQVRHQKVCVYHLFSGWDATATQQLFPYHLKKEWAT